MLLPRSWLLMNRRDRAIVRADVLLTRSGLGPVQAPVQVLEGALALGVPRHPSAELDSSCTPLPLALPPRPKIETENSPETFTSALSSGWRTSEIDSNSIVDPAIALQSGQLREHGDIRAGQALDGLYRRVGNLNCLVSPAGFALNDPISAHWQWSIGRYCGKEKVTGMCGIITGVCKTGELYRLTIPLDVYTFEFEFTITADGCSATLSDQQDTSTALALAYSDCICEPTAAVYTGELN
ncbi:hypothetical protein GSI_01376 [Ganoderma sinense ZZ0214-1]|uniref:Uncharacterized protein n=1 Tax=Ganoderma sinense ZZ0214-1 TaxID=1077348 RepID=A0A2G8SVB7_9APHY|nr:hypothetical protein GSI_01376 [Ganoderma sinense ZZ0214-1]